MQHSFVDYSLAPYSQNSAFLKQIPPFDRLYGVENYGFADITDYGRQLEVYLQVFGGF